MNIALDAYLQINKEFELTELDDEIILVSTQHEKAVYLNNTAQIILSMCSGENCLSDLIEKLQTHYPDESALREEITITLENLLNEKVIHLVSPSS